MTNTTKLALEAALKKELLTKSLDKITINELAEDCGISRMAFYYHFKDIYDLVEWSCVEDGTKALQGKKTSESWTEWLTQIFEAVLENKPFIMNVYRNVDRERIENYLFKLTYDLIVGVVEEKSKGLNITVCGNICYRDLVQRFLQKKPFQGFFQSCFCGIWHITPPVCLL